MNTAAIPQKKHTHPAGRSVMDSHDTRILRDFRMRAAEEPARTAQAETGRHCQGMMRNYSAKFDVGRSAQKLRQAPAGFFQLRYSAAAVNSASLEELMAVSMLS